MICLGWLGFLLFKNQAVELDAKNFSGKITA
jgi:hypothetical protein